MKDSWQKESDLNQLVNDLWEQSFFELNRDDIKYQWYLKELDGISISILREMLLILEKNEKYESCARLNAYINSRLRDDKLKELGI